MDDPTSCRAALSKAGAGGGGEERRSMLRRGEMAPGPGWRVGKLGQKQQEWKRWCLRGFSFPSDFR